MNVKIHLSPFPCSVSFQASLFPLVIAAGCTLQQGKKRCRRSHSQHTDIPLGCALPLLLLLCSGVDSPGAQGAEHSGAPSLLTLMFPRLFLSSGFFLLLCPAFSALSYTLSPSCCCSGWGTRLCPVVGPLEAAGTGYVPATLQHPMPVLGQLHFKKNP